MFDILPYRTVLLSRRVWRCVTWNVLERLAGWVSRSSTSEDEQEEDPAEPVEKPVESQLFHCADCDVTFISREMGACPQCDGELEETPSERELDRFHVH